MNTFIYYACIVKTVEFGYKKLEKCHFLTTRWRFKQGVCSVTCGGGLANRVLYCGRRSEGEEEEVLENSECNRLLKPTAVVPCNGHSCPSRWSTHPKHLETPGWCWKHQSELTRDCQSCRLMFYEALHLLNAVSTLLTLFCLQKFSFALSTYIRNMDMIVCVCEGLMMEFQSLN